jgi:hypothetical protein
MCNDCVAGEYQYYRKLCLLVMCQFPSEKPRILRQLNQWFTRFMVPEA